VIPKRTTIFVVLACLAASLATTASSRPAGDVPAEYLKASGEAGRKGGKLVVAQRAEPKTLNPVTAVDNPSREVFRRMHADLIHINRQSHKTEAALAKSWTASPDGRRYTLQLRRGIRFSDGHSFDADDVVFSFRVYTDEQVHSPQRDLLVVGGKPISVQKLDAYTLRFEFAQPYAAGDRLFDSLPMLPRHLLEKPYLQGKLAQAWTLATPPDQIAGLGPFRLKKCTPGQAITLERNPYYWKVDEKGNQLPYLDELTFILVPNDDAQVMRFEAGETDVISRLSADNFLALSKEQRARGFTLQDVGPGLEYNFVLFNLNDDTAGRLTAVARKQQWFRNVSFRQAVSAAIDRESIVRLVYHGRGVPLWGPVTPGNKLWLAAVPQSTRSVAKARELLKQTGFSWKADGTLIDSGGQAVEFSIISSSNNAARMQMATIIQHDLTELGMRVNVVPLEFRALVDRVTQTHDYEAAIMALGSGDVDPTADMNVWLSSGSTHLWNMGQKKPATAWEAEIDRLLQQQLTATDQKHRKQLYDRVQQVVAEQLPIICIASPNILVGAKKELGNFRPSILDHYTLSEVDEYFWRRR
jgi:peptide/nickel transport system substrate-binding protein